MSARKQVDRLTEREERRNARAYRRAARRAEMRRRWEALISSLNCFRAQPEQPRIQDYEEKRALILQDAFLEQSMEAAEKGEVMEAEIRELRNANQIVADLVRVGGSHQRVIAEQVSVPAIAAIMARSRASTGTLPSYTSEILPDYRSRYTRTEMGSSVRSDSLSAVSLDQYTIASSSPSSSQGENEAFMGSTPNRSNSPQSNSSCFTQTSSMVEFSPRPSAETLRTGRKSMDYDNDGR